MRKLLTVVSILAYLKGYSQSNKIDGNWYWIDDSTHKYAVDLTFNKDSSFEIAVADIPTTKYSRTYGTFKVIKDILFIHYSDDTGVGKIKFLGDDILQTSYLKGKHVYLIDNKTFFRMVLPKKSN